MTPTSYQSPKQPPDSATCKQSSQPLTATWIPNLPKPIHDPLCPFISGAGAFRKQGLFFQAKIPRDTERKTFRRKTDMEATAVYSSKGSPFVCSSRIAKPKPQNSATSSPFRIQSMATQKPLPSVAKTVGSRKVSSFQSPYAFGYYCFLASLLIVSMA